MLPVQAPQLPDLDRFHTSQSGQSGQSERALLPQSTPADVVVPLLERSPLPQSTSADVSGPLLMNDASSEYHNYIDLEYNAMNIESVRAKLDRDGEMAFRDLICAVLGHEAGFITHTDEGLRKVCQKLSVMKKEEVLRQTRQLATEIKAWMWNNKAAAILMFVGFGAAAYKAKTIEEVMKAQAENFVNWGRSATWYVRFFGFVLLMIVRLVVSTVVPPTSPGFGIILQAATPEDEKWTAMPLFLAASTVAGATPYVLDKAIQYFAPISRFRKDFMFSTLAKRFADQWPLTCWTGPTMVKIFDKVGGGRLGASLAVFFAHTTPFMGAQTTNMQRYFLPHPVDSIISQPFCMSENLIGMAVAEGATNPLLGSVSLIGIVVAFNFAEYFVFSKRQKAKALIIGVINLCIGAVFVYMMTKSDDMQEASAKKKMIMLGSLLITNVFVVPLLTSVVTSLCSCVKQDERISKRKQHSDRLLPDRNPPQKDPPSNLIVIGPPGVGKSTLLNRIAGKPLFKTGLGIGGGGVTKKAKTEYSERYKVNLIDTVGPSDSKEELRKAAARDFYEVTMGGGRFQFVFMINANQGRVREIDNETIKMYQDATTGLTEDKYGIIVNLCPKDMVTRASEDDQWSKEFVTELFKDVSWPTKHVWYFDFMLGLYGKDSTVNIPELSGYEQKFMESIPIINLPSQPVKKDVYMKTREELKREITLKEKEKQSKRISESHERSLKEKRDEEQRAARNTKIAVLFMISSVGLLFPALLTVLQVGEFDKQVLAALPLWSGASVQLQLWLFPYLAVFVIYKTGDVIRSFYRVVPSEEKPFMFCGETFRIWDCYVKQWHLTAVLQSADILSDLSVSFHKLLGGSGTAWVWCATTLVSCIVVPLYIAGKVKYYQMLVMEIVLEDMEQFVMSALDLYHASGDVPMTLISSSLFAFLGVLWNFGALQTKMSTD